MFDVTQEIIINAPADDVWEVLALQYDRVSEWATGIQASSVNPEPELLEGAPVTGRHCEVPGLGKTNERFTAFDANRRKFTYEAYAGMPFFVKTVSNTWQVADEGERTRVSMHLVADLNAFPGTLMAPFLRRQFEKNTETVVNDLKYYVEHGQPSPSKRAEMQ
ncbi:MAG: SRPBCC family protein [Chloroflexota bacterium]